MASALTSTVFLAFLLAVTPQSLAADQLDSEKQLPHLPLPRYNNDGVVQFMPRIINGTAANWGDFPAKVSIQNRRGAHFCGGSVVNTLHVVTAAHCVTNERGQVVNPTTVQVMGDDLSITSQGSNTRQVRAALLIFVHTQYNAVSLINDIAVIRVAAPFTFTTTFFAAQRSASTPADNMVCRVAGWGATREEGEASARLLAVELPIVNFSICNRAYANQLRRPGMFCAGYMTGGRDTCQGDSGGGLMCNNLLAGIVSFGYGCARPNYPGVYSDVSVNNAFVDSALVWNGGTQLNVSVPTTLRPSSATSIVTSTFMFSITLLVLMINQS